MGRPLAGVRILLVTHEWTLTGAPLLLAETARWLEREGATLASVNIGPRIVPFGDPPGEALSLDRSMSAVERSDLVIVNTVAAHPWVEQYASSGARVLWWIHEVDTAAHPAATRWLPHVSAAAFDSRASLDAWSEIGELPRIARVIHPGLSEGYHVPSRLSLPGFPRRSAVAARRRARLSLGVVEQDFLLGCFASYHPRKGQDLLAATLDELAARRPELPLRAVFAGFGDAGEARGFLAGLGLGAARVVGQRALPQTRDLNAMYPALDALVVNTQSPGEAFGRVILEAMSNAVPVLATSDGGVSEIVVDGVTGLLHPPVAEGQATLSRNIEGLAADRDLARRLGRAGARRLRERFTPRRFEREFLELIRAVLNVPRHRDSAVPAHLPSGR